MNPSVYLPVGVEACPSRCVRPVLYGTAKQPRNWSGSSLQWFTSMYVLVRVFGGLARKSVLLVGRDVRRLLFVLLQSDGHLFQCL